MSQENVELVDRFADAFNRRDLDACLALTDDDVMLVPRVGAMEGDYQGHDGVRRFYEALLGVWPNLTVTVGEVRDFGGVTVAVLHARGQGAGSDVPWDWTVWQVIRWRRAKGVWWGHFETRDEALEAMGLSVQDTHADS
jgi:ketosteroid isomerase-like protein